MNLDVTFTVDRPVEAVWDFYVVHHIENHPRWDPDIELWPITDGPLRVGSMIGRRNSRSGTPVEGTMEVTELEPNRVLGMRINDGPMEMGGRATFVPDGPERTTVTLSVEIPGMEDAMADRLERLIRRSTENIRRLIEAEY